MDDITAYFAKAVSYTRKLFMKPITGVNFSKTFFPSYNTMGK
jgi:hypothetical protein